MIAKIKSDIISAVISGAVGAVVTVAIGAVTVVSPLRDDIKVLEKSLERFKYGETIEDVRTDELDFSVESIERDSHNILRITLVINNLKSHARENFGIIKEYTTVQTENLTVYTADRIKIFNTTLSDSKGVYRAIPANAKHIPIIIEIDNFEPNHKYISSLVLQFNSDNRYNKHDAMFTDLQISDLATSSN